MLLDDSHIFPCIECAWFVSHSSFPWIPAFDDEEGDDDNNNNNYYYYL